MILDVVLLIIAGATIFTSAKNGLVKTVINALSLILAAVLSLFICPIVKNVVNVSTEKEQVLVYFIVFLVAWIAIKIIAVLLDKVISSLPIISSINTLGGVILGVLLCVFRISVYCIIVGAVLVIGQKLDLTLVENISLNDTVLLKYFYEYNPIYLLLKLLVK